MIYLFKCPDCGSQRNIEIPISDYDEMKNRQQCSNCGSILKRVIEFEGSIGGTGGYDAIVGRADWQS